MGYTLTNNATSTLAGSIADTATALSVQTGDASKFPTLGGSDWTYATLVDASGNVEVVKVTARSGANLTVVRGQDGTTALAWDAGDRIDVRLNVQALADLTEPGARVHDGTAATTMADADELGFWQNAATAWRKITWANLAKALIAGRTAKTTLADADTLPLSDSAASDAAKKITFANLFASVLGKVASVANYRANTDGLLGVNNVWSSAALVTLTDAATIAMDMSTFINATVTLAGNRTLGQPTNTKVGQSGVIRIVQDATGSRTLAFHADWKFAGGTDPTASTAANSVDLLYYHVVAANVIHASLNKAIS